MAVGQGARKLYTTGHVARFCQVSVPTVFNWIKAGKLKAYTTAGGQYRVRDIDLVAFMREHGMYIPPELERTVMHKILVADDDHAIRGLVCRLLGKIPDLDIEQAADGVEACIKIGTMLPDLLLLDISMPNMNGWDVIRKVKEDASLQHTKILVMSGIWDPKNEDQPEDLPEFEFIPKPFGEKELLGIVSRMLDLSFTPNAKT